MNYRHAFHAGNFADLLKHAMLTELLAGLTSAATPLTVIDTHAGAGRYDLTADMSLRTGEASRGIAVLMADDSADPAFDRLKAAVLQANGDAPLKIYPGSPMLIASALRPQDRYIACEIRDDDHAALRKALPVRGGLEVLKADGWATAVARTPRPPARALILIDPPFERADDYAQCVGTSGAVLRTNGKATVAIWTPIKDLATFDAFICDLEDILGGAEPLVAQVRLRGLTDPMKMNGCAMVVVNPTPGLAPRAEAIAAWIAGRLGEPDALARVTGA